MMLLQKYINFENDLMVHESIKLVGKEVGR
jgi:hypothetical protein